MLVWIDLVDLSCLFDLKTIIALSFLTTKKEILDTWPRREKKKVLTVFTRSISSPLFHIYAHRYA